MIYGVDISQDWYWLIVGILFLVGEFIGHFILHNRRFTTVSYLTQYAEKVTGIWGHIALAVVWIAIGVHLEGVY